MPSPEAGGGHHTEGLKASAQPEFDDGILAHDLAHAAGEQYGCLTPTDSQPTHSQPPSQPSVLDETHGRSSRTIPLKDDDAPSTIIRRPRSSGELPADGFKYSRAKQVHMDMTRRRGPKSQANDTREPRPATKQGHPGAPFVDDEEPNTNEQDLLACQESGVGHSKDMTSDEPFYSPSGNHGAHLDALPSQTGPTADSQEKLGPNKVSSASHPPQLTPPLSGTAGRNTKRSPREQQCSTDSLGSAAWIERESTSGSSATSGTDGSQVHSRPPHNRVKALIQQDVNARVRRNALQQLPEQNEHTMDAYLQSQDHVGSERNCYVQDHHQKSPGIEKQPSSNVPSHRGPSNPKPDFNKERQLHSLNAQAGPTRITKTGAGTKHPRGNTNPAKGTGHSGQPINSSKSTPDIRSSHVLAIWQKVFEKEQRDETAKEVARRESCEVEINRLRSAEQEYDAALKAAKKAKLNASTKLQQLQNANEGLNARIQELEACLSNTSHEVKELQRDKKSAAKICAKAEKKIEFLEADKKSLIISHDDEKQKASRELSAMKLKLAETQKDLENSKQLIERLNKDVSQRDHSLAEQKDRVAQLLRSNEDTLAKYNDVEGGINSLGQSLEKPLEDLTHSVKELLDQQATKDSVDGILERIKNILSPLTDQHVDIDNLQTNLLTMNDSLQTKFDDLKKSTESFHRDDTAFEHRLVSRLQEEFTSFASSQERLVEIQNEKAALEERCNSLQHRESELQKKFDAAVGAQEAGQRSLIEVQTELSCLRSSLTVDSTQLQQLEISKAAVDSELRNALTRVHGEEQKLRALSEVELGLRREVMELKEQLRIAKDSISKSQADSNRGRPNISELIETEQESARLYYAKYSRDVVQDVTAKHANELHTEQEKSRQAGAQIESLKEQIHRKNAELQSLRTANPAKNTTIDDLERQLEVARSENARIQKLRETEHDEKLKEIQQQLNDLQGQKQEIDLKYQQVQQNNDTVQEQLQASNNERARLYQQLEETQPLLKESEQEAAAQKSDAEEMLLQREEQWAAEADGIRGQLQESNAQMERRKASHRLQCEEYEEQLRSHLHMRENYEPGQYVETTQQPKPQVEDAFRPPVSISSKPLGSPSPEAMIPAANSGSIRKPRRKLDRSNKSVSHAVDKTQPEQTQLLHDPTEAQSDYRPRLEDSRTRTNHLSSNGSTFGEDFWVSQELGRHERLTEQGVTLLPPHGEIVAEIPETLQDRLSKPKLFSEFAKEQADRQEDNLTSGFSSAPSSDSDTPEGLTHLQREDPVEATPTPRFRGTDGTVRQTNATMDNPFFQEERPVSRANTSRRLDSSYQPRQESYQSSSAVTDTSQPRTPFRPRYGTEAGTTTTESGQGSSPLFMDPPKPKKNVTYGHHHTTQSTHTVQNVNRTPSGAVKRSISGEDDTSSSKRVKGTSSKYRSSPIMTRAISRAGPRSQVAETQSQDLHVRFPEEPSQASANARSQAETAPLKPSQPQSQRPARVPSMSRMRTSEGSSSGDHRNSTPKNARRRKADEIGGRFDQEIKNL